MTLPILFKYARDRLLMVSKHWLPSVDLDAPLDHVALVVDEAAVPLAKSEVFVEPRRRLVEDHLKEAEGGVSGEELQI